MKFDLYERPVFVTGSRGRKRLIDGEVAASLDLAIDENLDKLRKGACIRLDSVVASRGVDTRSLKSSKRHAASLTASLRNALREREDKVIVRVVRESDGSHRFVLALV